MQLNRAARDHRSDRTLNRLRGNAGLFRPRDQHDDALRIENRADAHREGALRHRLRRVEIDGVLRVGRRSQRLRPGAAAERRDRLVETDVPVVADAEQLKIDAARILDRFLIAEPLGDFIPGEPVRQIRVPHIDVDLAEQMLVHIVAVRIRVLRRQPDVFVEIEGVHAREIDAARLVHFGEVGVDRLHRRTGREPELEKRFLPDRVGDQFGSESDGLFRSGTDNDFHDETFR